MQQKKTTKEEYQKCVNVVVEYIIQHLGEDIDLKSLARISNFSPFYFHRIMKAFLGEPIGTFIVRTRTEAAKTGKAGNIALARGGWDRYQDGRFHFFEEGHTTDAEGENLGKQGGGVLGAFFKAEH